MLLTEPPKFIDLPSQSFAAFTILAMSPKLIKRLNSFCRAGLHVWQTPLAVRPVSWCPWFLVKTLNCPELPTLLTKIGRHPAAWRGKLLYTGWWCQSKHPKTQICLRIPPKTHTVSPITPCRFTKWWIFYWKNRRHLRSNPLYNPEKHTVSVPDLGVIFLTIWDEHHDHWNHQPKQLSTWFVAH